MTSRSVEAIIRHPAVRGVSFTGSDRVGANIAATAASEIKPCVLELGGSDPTLVLADADLERAADTIVLSRIINAGQSCIAAKRILVEQAVYEPMLARLHSRFAKLKLGDPKLESTDVGPIARAELRQGLHRQVVSSIEAGARLLLGGEMPIGEALFYPITMLADVTPDMVVSCEETFGPIAVVTPVADAKEGLRLANDTPYGLGASIWCAKVAEGEQMAAQIESGQVAVNGIVKTDPRLPSGGVKRSGYGRELGPHGIKMFVNAQQIWLGRTKIDNLVVQNLL